jgi:hypothetical protein
MKGNLHSNGFLYIKTHCLNATSYPLRNWKKFSTSFYPKKLSGRIDFLGNIEIQVTETAYSLLIPKRPKGYKCSSIKNGKMEFEIESLGTQSNRNEYTTNLVGDPFLKNEALRKEFIRNKIILESYL